MKDKLLRGSACAGLAMTGCFTHEPPRFVAVGDGVIERSDDGVSWETSSSGGPYLSSVAWGNGRFVAVGRDGNVTMSYDAREWSRRRWQQGNDLSHVMFLADKFVAVGGDWETGAIVLVSDDGLAWDELDAPDGHMFHAVAARGSTLIAAARTRSDLGEPSLFTSALSSGSVASGWTPHTGPDFVDSLELGDETFVVNDRVARSRDGVTWTEHDVPTAYSVHSIATDGARFVVVGELGAIASSDDGSTWTDRSTGTLSLTGVVHGAARFVAVGQGGSVLVSQDGGTTWTPGRTNTTNWLTDVAVRSD